MVRSPFGDSDLKMYITYIFYIVVVVSVCVVAGNFHLVHYQAFFADERADLAGRSMKGSPYPKVVPLYSSKIAVYLAGKYSLAGE